MDELKTPVTSFLTRVSGVLSLCVFGGEGGKASCREGVCCVRFDNQGIGRMPSFRAFADLLLPGIYQHDDPGLGIGKRCTIMASHNISAIQSKHNLKSRDNNKFIKK